MSAPRTGMKLKNPTEPLLTARSSGKPQSSVTGLSLEAKAESKEEKKEPSVLVLCDLDDDYYPPPPGSSSSASAVSTKAHDKDPSDPIDALATPGYPYPLMDKTLSDRRTNLSARLRVSGRGRGSSYRGMFGSVFTLPVSSLGNINTTIGNASLSSSGDFPLAAAMFDEFFVHGFTMTYSPLNMFQTQPSMTYVNPASCVLYVVPLYHGASAYTTTDLMINNVALQVRHSGTAWKARCKNNEKFTTVLTAPDRTSPYKTQSWCLTSSVCAVLYQGFLQLRNNFSITGAASSNVADYCIQWDVSFRARV